MKMSDQCFMVDESILGEISDLACLRRQDIVCEIGAGGGNLTRRLVGRARVFAVEKDPRLVERLRERFVGLDLNIVEGDFLKTGYFGYNKVVSNIPYSISRQIVEKLVVDGFELAILVVQYEFARKLMAKPGKDNYRAVSALIQSSCDVELVRKIPNTAFQPCPRVQSALIRLRHRHAVDAGYVSFLKGVFSKKNKILKNVLPDAGGLENVRAGDVGPDELLDIYRRL
jgi:16S rRNA (adenine1518-N6/adenine1519-N6)-dimethyltransferase